MQIQVNTDNNTQGSAELTQKVRSFLEDKLARFSERITRIEVQLSDQNSSAKGGSDDQQCRLEARLGGMQPVVVTDQGATQEEALRGAVSKAQRVIGSALGKLGRQ